MSQAFTGKGGSVTRMTKEPPPPKPLAKWVEDKNGGHWEFPQEVKTEEPEYVEQTYGEIV